MRWVVIVGAYVILWFLALQILLPIGNVHEEPEAGANLGTEPGAPAHARIGLKLAGATVIAGLVWAVFYGLVLAHILDI